MVIWPQRQKSECYLSTTQGMTGFANKLQKIEWERKHPLVEFEREHIPAILWFQTFNCRTEGHYIFFKLPSLVLCYCNPRKLILSSLPRTIISFLGLVKWWYSLIIGWKTSIKRNISFTTIWNSVHMAKIGNRFTCLYSEW